MTELRLHTRDEHHRQSAVKVLRELLEEAEAGKIETVHIAAFYFPVPGDSDNTVRMVSSHTERISQSIGAMFRLMCDLHAGNI